MQVEGIAAPGGAEQVQQQLAHIGGHHARRGQGQRGPQVTLGPCVVAVGETDRGFLDARQIQAAREMQPLHLQHGRARRPRGRRLGGLVAKRDRQGRLGGGTRRAGQRPLGLVGRLGGQVKPVGAIGGRRAPGVAGSVERMGLQVGRAVGGRLLGRGGLDALRGPRGVLARHRLPPVGGHLGLDGVDFLDRLLAAIAFGRHAALEEGGPRHHLLGVLLLALAYGTQHVELALAHEVVAALAFDGGLERLLVGQLPGSGQATFSPGRGRAAHHLHHLGEKAAGRFLGHWVVWAIAARQAWASSPGAQSPNIFCLSSRRCCASSDRLAVGRASRRPTPMASPVSSQ